METGEYAHRCKMMMLSHLFLKASGVLASQVQDAPPPTDPADPGSRKDLFKSFAEDWKAKYIMETSGGSHHPLCIKPVRKINRRKVSGLNGKLILPLSLSISPAPPSQVSFPLPADESVCPGAAPPVPVSSGGCGGRARPVWAGAAGGCGAGPALRSRPLPPHLRPPARTVEGQRRERRHRDAARSGAGAAMAAAGGPARKPVLRRGGRRAAAGGQPGRDAAGGGGAYGGHAAQAAQRGAGGEGEVRGGGCGGTPRGGGPFLPHPRVGPHRTCSTGVSAAFGNSRQQPPLRDPRRGRADAATKKPWPLPEAATSAFWAGGARKSPVLPPFSGGGGGRCGCGGRSLLRFWRCFLLAGGFSRPAHRPRCCAAPGAPCVGDRAAKAPSCRGAGSQGAKMRADGPSGS